MDSLLEQFRSLSPSSQFLVLVASVGVPLDMIVMLVRKVSSGSWDPGQPHLSQRLQFTLHAMGWLIPAIAAISLARASLDYLVFLCLLPIGVAIYLSASHNGGKRAWLARQAQSTGASTSPAKGQ